MRPELAQVVAAWPLGASLAAAVALQGVYAGRRRSALNEALHELRRPLQTLALAASAEPVERAGPVPGAVAMAASALERLEREINGDSVEPLRVAVAVRPLLEAARCRWQERAASAGASLSLVDPAAELRVEADPLELARALDNLIANALEHGGPEIRIAARRRDGGLELAVLDSGAAAVRPSWRRSRLVATTARISGRGRRGHGLRIVRRLAAVHGGELRLRATEAGTEAAIRLPLSGETGGRR
jgi:signal transduction histidine kinase